MASLKSGSLPVRDSGRANDRVIFVRSTRSRTLTAYPLRRVRTLAPQRIDASCQSRPKAPQQEKARYANGLIGQSLALWQLKAERTVSFHKQLTPHLRFVGRTGISFSKRTTLRMRQRAPRPTSTRGS